MKKLLKIVLSILAVPISISMLRVIYAYYEINFVYHGPMKVGALPGNPLASILFIISIFTLPGILIWIIWKKI